MKIDANVNNTESSPHLKGRQRIPQIAVPTDWSDEDDKHYYHSHYGEPKKDYVSDALELIACAFYQLSENLDAAIFYLGGNDSSDEFVDYLELASTDLKVAVLYRLACNSKRFGSELHGWLLEEVAAVEATVDTVNAVLLRFGTQPKDIRLKELVECGMWLTSAASDLNELLSCNFDGYVPPSPRRKLSAHAPPSPAR